MAGIAAGALQQFHSRLAVPSAVWTTGRSFTGTPQDTSHRTSTSSKSLSSSTLKSALNFQVDYTSSPKSRHLGNESCVAFSSTVEPAVLFSAAKAMKPSTLYDVLGISDMVTDDEIKAAFRRIAKEVHPDQAPPDQVKEYQQKFMEAHKAYSVLKDPRTRSLYNYEMRNSVYSMQLRAEDWKRPTWRGCNWETDQCWTS